MKAQAGPGLTRDRVVRILLMACGALSEAHGIGLIHRDIKPANIMLCTRGGEFDVVELLAFGLVKQLQVDGDRALTGASTLTGTPQYMAPESIRAPESVDARTDIYMLGAVAYYLLAGGELFRGQSIIEVCGQYLHEPPEPFAARGASVPPELESIVFACLEKDLPDAVVLDHLVATAEHEHAVARAEQHVGAAAVRHRRLHQVEHAVAVHVAAGEVCGAREPAIAGERTDRRHDGRVKTAAPSFRATATPLRPRWPRRGGRLRRDRP